MNEEKEKEEEVWGWKRYLSSADQACLPQGGRGERGERKGERKGERGKGKGKEAVREEVGLALPHQPIKKP